MARNTTKYGAVYRQLISLYPREFREQLGESMEQTFKDLCRERIETGERVFGFALWTMANTLLSIIKEKHTSMKLKTKVHITAIVLLIAALVFLGIVWWINGRDDTWLYATSGIIVLSSVFPIFTEMRKDKNK